MGSLGLILLSTGLISLGALVGVVTLWMNQEKVERFLLFLVALSTGALMGGAFLHLLPEAVERVGSEVSFLAALGALDRKSVV